MSDLQSPLEQVFGIDPNSTPTFYDSPELPFRNERASTLIDSTNGDILARSNNPNPNEIDREERLEDLHIDAQLETIHTGAMNAFEKTSRLSDDVDPKFAARNAEVAAQYLHIALQATNARVDAKYKRQKIKIANTMATTANTYNQTNNNVIVADRNQILQQILGLKNPTEGNSYEAI